MRELNRTERYERAIRLLRDMHRKSRNEDNREAIELAIATLKEHVAPETAPA